MKEISPYANTQYRLKQLWIEDGVLQNTVNAIIKEAREFSVCGKLLLEKQKKVENTKPNVLVINCINTKQ